MTPIFIPVSASFPSGFIFNGAADIQKSKNWIRVQRPYIPEDEVGEDNPKVHDITVITHYEIK